MRIVLIVLGALAVIIAAAFTAAAADAMRPVDKIRSRHIREVI